MAPLQNIGRTASGTTLIDTRPTSMVGLDVVLIPSVPGFIVDRVVTVTAAWNRAVDGFTEDDITLRFYNQDGMIEERRVGWVSHFNGNDGDLTFDFRVNLPNNSVGNVDIIVGAGAATDTLDAAIAGPPAPRVLVVSYNTSTALEGPTLEISVPELTPYRDRIYPVMFTFSQPVGGFSMADIELNLTTASIGSPESQNDPDSVYIGLLTLPDNSSGRIIITVEANSVQGPLSTGPPGDTTAAFDFDTRTQDRTITGATDIHTETKTLATVGDGGFAGCLELIQHGNIIYAVIQRLSDRGSSPNNFLSLHQQAGADLISYNIDTSTYTILKSYEYVTQAARSLTIHNNALHFFEGSHYAYIENDHLDRVTITDVVTGERETVRSYAWKADIGNLMSIDGGLETLGSWRTAFVNPDREEAPRDRYFGRHGGTASPMVSAGGKLNLIPGYGNLNNIGDIDDPVSDEENWTWLQLDDEINSRIPVALTNNRTGWDVLQDTAISTGTYIGFDVDGFFMREHWPFMPDTPLTRDSSEVDHIITLRSLHPTQEVVDINFRNAEEVFYNSVVVYDTDNNPYSRSNTNSISTFGERELVVRSLYSPTQAVLCEWLAQNYLDRFSVLRQIVNLSLDTSLYIKIGDILWLDIGSRSHLQRAVQVVEITHRQIAQETEIIGITL